MYDTDFDEQDLHDIEAIDNGSRAPQGYCSGCGNTAPVNSRCCDGESVDPA